jgi:hypothetical protein
MRKERNGSTATLGRITAAFLATGILGFAATPPVFRPGTPLVRVSKKTSNGSYDFAGYYDKYTTVGISDNVNVAAPELVDWNNDGLMDLLVGEADGRIALFLNQGTRGHPVFSEYRYLTLSNG